MKMVAISQNCHLHLIRAEGIIIGRSAGWKQSGYSLFYYGKKRQQPKSCFVEDGEGIRTEAFDPSKLEDPSLIIYAPVRVRQQDHCDKW